MVKKMGKTFVTACEDLSDLDQLAEAFEEEKTVQVKNYLIMDFKSSL